MLPLFLIYIPDIPKRTPQRGKDILDEQNYLPPKANLRHNRIIRPPYDGFQPRSTSSPLCVQDCSLFQHELPQICRDASVGLHHFGGITVPLRHE